MRATIPERLSCSFERPSRRVFRRPWGRLRVYAGESPSRNVRSVSAPAPRGAPNDVQEISTIGDARTYNVEGDSVNRGASAWSHYKWLRGNHRSPALAPASADVRPAVSQRPAPRYARLRSASRRAAGDPRAFPRKDRWTMVPPRSNQHSWARPSGGQNASSSLAVSWPSVTSTRRRISHPATNRMITDTIDRRGVPVNTPAQPMRTGPTTAANFPSIL